MPPKKSNLRKLTESLKKIYDEQPLRPTRAIPASEGTFANINSSNINDPFYLDLSATNMANPSTAPLQYPTYDPSPPWACVSQLWLEVPSMKGGQYKKGFVSAFFHANPDFLHIVGKLLVDTALRNTLDDEPKVTGFTVLPSDQNPND